MQTNKNRIRIIILILLLLIGISNVYSQDMIVMRDGTSIDVIILEVSPSEIRFRKAGSPEEPVRTALTSDVNMIIYENRTVEEFSHPETNSGMGGRIEFTKPRIAAFYGVSMSKLSKFESFFVNGTPSHSQKVGFANLGGSIWLPNLLPHTIIEPGIRLTSKGSEAECQDDYYDDVFENSSQNLLYLDIFGKARLDTLPMPVYPFVGFSTGFLLSAKWDEEYNYQGGKQTMSGDNKDSYKTMDFGLLFGVDILIQNRVTLGYEYNLGLSDIGKEVNTKNRTSLFTIGVLF